MKTFVEATLAEAEKYLEAGVSIKVAGRRVEIRQGHTLVLKPRHAAMRVAEGSGRVKGKMGLGIEIPGASKMRRP